MLHFIAKRKTKQLYFTQKSILSCNHYFTIKNKEEGEPQHKNNKPFWTQHCDCNIKGLNGSDKKNMNCYYPI